MPISAVDAISPAFEHTKQQLFKPFRFGQWTRLAFVGLLAGELGSFHEGPGIGDRAPEIVQRLARLADHAGAVHWVLVPVRGQSQERPGVARAQGANNNVVNARGILDGDHVLALCPLVAELGGRGGSVIQQSLFELRIDPSVGRIAFMPRCVTANKWRPCL